jgi:DNA-binding NtrC family response regulator
MKIFLIDDLKITNLVNKKYLTMTGENIEVLDFEDPMAAMEALIPEFPDLIFLDLGMPEVSGWDMLNYMKQEQLPIQVIILTASESEGDRAKAKTYSNVISFQVKPLLKNNMIDLVKDVMKKGRKKAS